MEPQSTVTISVADNQPPLVQPQNLATGEAAAIARAHLADIGIRIARLETLRSALTEVATSCEGGRAAECRVIEAIAGTELALQTD